MNLLVSCCFGDILDYLPFRVVLRILILNKVYRTLFLTRFCYKLANRRSNFFKETLLSLAVSSTIRFIKPVVLNMFIAHFKGFGLPIKIITCNFIGYYTGSVVLGVMILNTFWRIFIDPSSGEISCSNRGLYKQR